MGIPDGWVVFLSGARTRQGAFWRDVPNAVILLRTSLITGDNSVVLILIQDCSADTPSTRYMYFSKMQIHFKFKVTAPIQRHPLDHYSNTNMECHIPRGHADQESYPSLSILSTSPFLF